MVLWTTNIANKSIRLSDFYHRPTWRFPRVMGVPPYHPCDFRSLETQLPSCANASPSAQCHTFRPGDPVQNRNGEKPWGMVVSQAPNTPTTRGIIWQNIEVKWHQFTPLQLSFIHRSEQPCFTYFFNGFKGRHHFPLNERSDDFNHPDMDLYMNIHV